MVRASHPWVSGRKVTLLLAVVGAAIAGPADATTCPELDLVLAVDVSNSVDRREYRLQVGGIAAAFRDPDVQAAIAGVGGIGVSVVFWADAAYTVDFIDRRVVTGRDDAELFARTVGAAPRRQTGNTALGYGLWSALDRLDDPAVCGGRKVIDLSGDGRESLHRPASVGASSTPIRVNAARLRAERAGVTANGLAIVSDEPDLAAYYASTILTGPGAFVMEAAGYEDFADAMRKKLLREIQPAIGVLDDGATFAASTAP
jgi:hypothetical protein